MNYVMPAKTPSVTGSRPVRVMALEWNVPMLIDVLVELSGKYGWEPVYCVSERTEEQFKRHFPAAIYHDTVDARFGRPPPALRNLAPVIIDQPTHERLAPVQVLALKQMYRQELLGSFALHDRVILFNRLVAYWSAVLDAFQPDVLINANPPHVVYDYVAHALARQRGITTIMFEWVTSAGLLVPVASFEDGLPPVMDAYRRLRANPPAGPVVLSDRLEQYWRSLQGDYQQAKPYWFAANEIAMLVAAEEASTGKRFLRHARARVAPLLKEPRTLWRAPIELAKAALIASEPPTVAGHCQGRFYKVGEMPAKLARKVERERRRHCEAVKRYYDALAAVPDLTKPYIYVTLHAQPERATNPNGGVFDEQDVMIGLLASVLPKGWRIYVKEHPSQFFPILPDNGRWTTTYDAMLAHAGVSFVPRQTSSFDLIDRAQAVASVTGTACWEAVARGIPALAFGESWYKGCEGVHIVRTARDCKQALQRIMAGECPDPEAVRLFLRAAQEVCTTAYLNDDDARAAGIDQSENVPVLARVIVDFYRSRSGALSPVRAEQR
jgi:hypothetical protein